MQTIGREEFINIVTGHFANDHKYEKYYKATNVEPVVLIQDVQLSWIELKDDVSYPHAIVLNNVVIDGIFNIKGGRFLKRFVVVNAVANNDLSFLIEGGDFQQVFLHFGDKFDSHCVIHNGNFKYLEFDNSSSIKGIDFFNGVYEDLYILKNLKSEVSINFNGGEYNRVELNASVYEINFSNINVYHLILFTKLNVSHVNVSSGDFGSIWIESDNIKNINILYKSVRDEVIDHWKFVEKLSKEEQNYLLEKRAEIKHLQFARIGKAIVEVLFITLDDLNMINLTVNKEAIINIKNVNVTSLHMAYVYNYGQMIFTGVYTRGGKLSIKHSDLGKAIFSDCDLSDSTFTFVNSKIYELFVSGTIMPESIVGAPVQQRIGYSQLKKVYESRGDNIESLLYFSREMNAYYESMPWNRNNSWEKMNLLLNKLSTNHGLSWKRGIISTLAVSILLYTIYCIMLGFRLDFGFTEKSLNTFIALFSYYGDFLNPVHKTDYIVDSFKIENVFSLRIGLARVIESLSRIFITYFIYQFVQAFRKFGKK